MNASLPTQVPSDQGDAVDDDPAGCKALVSWLAGQGVRLDDLSPSSTMAQLVGRTTAERKPRAAARRSPPRSPLRVLMPICQKIGSTGSGVVVRELVERLASRGLCVRVLCGAEPGDATRTVFRSPAVVVESLVFGPDASADLPFPIVGMSDKMPYRSTRFRDLSFEDLELYLNVWRDHIVNAVASYEPHIIHVHHLWALAAVCAASVSHIPIVVSLHGTDLQQAHLCPHIRGLVAPWASCIERTLALTPASVREAQQLYAMPSSRFTVLGNGFNSDLFKPLESPDHTIAERYGLDQEATQKMILFVGKYVEWKGIAWLLQAFANLPQQAACGSTLVVAGTGPQSEKKRYLAMANDLNIERRVRFTGEIAYEDVGSLMNVASVFVLPSYREPFGLALLEALACGCRIVAVDQGGPAVFVPDELKLAKDAILVPGLPESSPTAASAAAFVEHLSAALAEQLDKPSSYDCRCNIARAVQPWSWDTYLDRLLPIYGEIVANGVADDG